MNINATRGVAFVVVTHNRPLAELMRRQLVMRDGVVYEDGP
jgi:ABC-type lipoprotein export system ATPase subunit